MKKQFVGIMFSALFVLMLAGTFAAMTPVYASDTAEEETITESTSAADYKPIGAAIVVGLAATGGAIGMGIAIAKSNEGVARQPEAQGPIRTQLMLGLVFIETVVIYALIVAILIIFVM